LRTRGESSGRRRLILTAVKCFVGGVGVSRGGCTGAIIEWQARSLAHFIVIMVFP